jgi:hypothetical protein
MKNARFFLIVAMLLPWGATALAQQPPVQSPLLEHMIGHWVLQGTIAREQTTHDVTAEWVLDHHYIQIHEVSREKDKAGKRKYEAIIFVAMNDSPKQYACAWHDVYGGILPVSLGFAEPLESELPFVFKDEKGEVSFTNSFIYDANADTWEWRMDNVANGVARPFGRVKLTRKPA